MPTKTLQRGQQAEEKARRYLCKQGLKLVTRNFRSRYGEIDLIMRERDTLVFVEVRYRSNQTFGLAEETVDWRKQARLRATAEYYLQSEKVSRDQPCRFDVMAISGHDKKMTINWYTNAF